MFGDLFLFFREAVRYHVVTGFRPHVWGSFFIDSYFIDRNGYIRGFRPHVWGSFFIQNGKRNIKFGSVFVPMFGDLFLLNAQRLNTN